MEPKLRPRKPRIDWSRYLRAGETLESVSHAVLQHRRHRYPNGETPRPAGKPPLFDKALTPQEKAQRVQEKKNILAKQLDEKLAAIQERIDHADELRQAKLADLRWYAEEAFDVNAKTSAAEIEIHRQFLRALNEYDPTVQPDVLSGEALPELAKRVWNALITSTIVTHDEHGGTWFPLYSPKLGKFQHFHGVKIDNAQDPDWFDKHWQPPADSIDVRV